MAPDYRRQLERALARQIKSGASRQTRQIEIDCKALDQAAQATSASDLSVADLAEGIADAINPPNVASSSTSTECLSWLRCDCAINTKRLVWIASIAASLCLRRKIAAEAK